MNEGNKEGTEGQVSIPGTLQGWGAPGETAEVKGIKTNKKKEVKGAHHASPFRAQALPAFSAGPASQSVRPLLWFWPSHRRSLLSPPGGGRLFSVLYPLLSLCLQRAFLSGLSVIWDLYPLYKALGLFAIFDALIQPRMKTPNMSNIYHQSHCLF